MEKERDLDKTCDSNSLCLINIGQREWKGRQTSPVVLGVKPQRVWDKLVLALTWERVKHRTTDEDVCRGCLDVIAIPADYIISINDSLSLTSVPCRGHSRVSTLGSCECLSADSALFPGYCSLLFDINSVSHCEAFQGESRHASLSVCSYFTKYLFIIQKAADHRTVWPFNTGWHLKGISLSLSLLQNLPQKLLGCDGCHSDTGACISPLFQTIIIRQKDLQGSNRWPCVWFKVCISFCLEMVFSS